MHYKNKGYAPVVSPFQRRIPIGHGVLSGGLQGHHSALLRQSSS